MINSFAFKVLGESYNKKEENIYKSIFGFKINLPKEYIVINSKNLKTLNSNNLNENAILRLKLAVLHKKQEIYLDKTQEK